MSVEKTESRTGVTYKVRWRHAGVHHARRFTTLKAAERFERKVKDLKAAGELHLLDELPRGTITLRDYAYEVWWPDYAEVNLTDEGRANYGVQLDLRIIPEWGDHQLRQLRPAPIEAWVARLRKEGVGDPTIIKTLTVFRSILKRAERDEEIDRNPIPLVAKPKQERTREPRPVAPYYVELIRKRMLDPTQRRDKRGHRHARRPELDRHRDATARQPARVLRPASGIGSPAAAVVADRRAHDQLPRDEGRPGQATPHQTARTARPRPRRVPHPLRQAGRGRAGLRQLVGRRLGQLARADLPAGGAGRRPHGGHHPARPPRQLRQPADLRGSQRARGGRPARAQAEHLPGHLRAPVRGVRPRPPASRRRGDRGGEEGGPRRSCTH